MQNITRIPISTVINTVLENLIAGGVITREEKEKFRPVVAAMDGQELIETLLDSHVLKENIMEFHDQQFHISERLN
jgi:hypothetical protein